MNLRSKDISVVLATFNRANILRKTLDAMSSLDIGGLSVEFIVVDNGSTDETCEVIESFAGKMNILHLYESDPGKSSALNLALEKADLGDIVVFTDDDVIPKKDWLMQIKEACSEHNDFEVFGGRILLNWPYENIPLWANNKNIQYWAFGLHDLGDISKPYAERNYPGGANYWVRKKAITRSIRFDSQVGPRPSNYAVMGTETSFLHLLRISGCKILYEPKAVLGHMVQSHLIDRKVLIKRAFRWGRGMPHRGVCHRNLYSRNRQVWRAIRAMSLVRHAAGMSFSYLKPDFDKRVISQLDRVTKLGYDLESLIISRGDGKEAVL